MERLEDERLSRQVFIACWLAYAVSTVVKCCVPTVIPSMIEEGFLTKSQSGLIPALFYLVYSIGQLLFGKYFNNHAPFLGVKLMLISSVAACVLMSLTRNFYVILIVWAAYAAISSGMWPAIMKIVSSNLIPKHCIWSNKYLAIGYQVGSLFCIFTGSAIIKYLGWRRLYLFSAVICVLIYLYWQISEARLRRVISVKPNIDKAVSCKASDEANKKPITVYFGTGLFLLLPFTFFISLLNTGVCNWVPTIVMETYDTSPSFSVLLNAVVMVVNIAFITVMGAVVSPGKLKVSLILLITALPLLILMNFTSILNEYTYVLILSAFTSITAYIETVNYVHVPFAFVRYNDVSRITGIINMCLSIGVLVASYLYGLLADAFGWQFIMRLWVAFAVIGITLIICCIPLWKKFTNRKT